MKRKFALIAAVFLSLVASATAQDQPGKVKMEASHWRASKKHADGGHTVHFYDHAEYVKKRGEVKVAAGTWPAPPSVFDHGAKIDYPMLLNDQLGCCFYSAICHHDQTFTGNNGKQSQFDLKVFRQRYLSLSGGDNGLGDQDVQREWRDRYLADVTEAKAFDYFYIDVTNPAVLSAAIHAMGGIQFTFTVAPAWISNSDEGDVWEANTYRPNNNGHAVHLVGVDAKGYYKLITWGTWVWISPAAIRVCSPDGFVVSSVRWFNAKGYAPTGRHITEVSKIIQAAGGKAFPANIVTLFPPPGVDPGPIPAPIPGPIPTPSPGIGKIRIEIDGQKEVVYELSLPGSKERQEKLEAAILEYLKANPRTLLPQKETPKGDPEPKAKPVEEEKKANPKIKIGAVPAPKTDHEKYMAARDDFDAWWAARQALDRNVEKGKAN